MYGWHHSSGVDCFELLYPEHEPCRSRIFCNMRGVSSPRYRNFLHTGRTSALPEMLYSTSVRICACINSSAQIISTATSNFESSQNYPSTDSTDLASLCNACPDEAILL